jgi:hypothetical protein
LTQIHCNWDRNHRIVPTLSANESAVPRARSCFNEGFQASQPAPTGIALCDDVLTSGAHYRAALSVMQQAFPGVRIIGLFIAPRVPEAMDFEDFDA